MTKEKEEFETRMANFIENLRTNYWKGDDASNSPILISHEKQLINWWSIEEDKDLFWRSIVKKYLHDNKPKDDNAIILFAHHFTSQVVRPEVYLALPRARYFSDFDERFSRVYGGARYNMEVVENAMTRIRAIMGSEYVKEMQPEVIKKIGKDIHGWFTNRKKESGNAKQWLRQFLKVFKENNLRWKEDKVTRFIEILVTGDELMETTDDEAGNYSGAKASNEIMESKNTARDKNTDGSTNKAAIRLEKAYRLIFEEQQKTSGSSESRVRNNPGLDNNFLYFDDEYPHRE